jgi:tRNA U34 5-methylaminomethyl-2-thiouridine-forming methyltransferase MnmC
MNATARQMTGHETFAGTHGALPLIRTTADGSHTLLRPDLDETYHSTQGALEEALHVYVRAGLQVAQTMRRDLRILEIGFGTGLNALLTLLERRLSVDTTAYVSVEPSPLPLDLVARLNYPDVIPSFDALNLFAALHDAPWNSVTTVLNHFRLRKIRGRVQHVELGGPFDLVYFDAFAPNKQPEMWTTDVFSRIHAAMNDAGILVTYCAKGEVKRTLKSVGFEVESLPGFGGKREMTRAWKVGALAGI